MSPSEIKLTLTLRPRTQFSVASVRYSCPENARAWYSAASAVGSVPGSHRRQICRLAKILNAKSYVSQIWLFCPFAGSSLATALVPLYNRMGNDAVYSEGTLNLYSFNATDAHYSANQGLLSMPGGVTLLLGNTTYSAIFGPLGASRSIGFYLPVASDGDCIPGIYDDRASGVLANRIFVSVRKTAPRCLSRYGNASVNGSCDVVGFTYAPGGYHWTYEENTLGKAYQNGVDLGATGGSIASSASLRGGFPGLAQAQFGDPPGPDPTTSFGSTGTIVAAMWILDGAMSPADVADFMSVVETEYVIPMGRA